MRWIKRGIAESIKEVIEANSGIAENELLYPKATAPDSIEGMKDAANVIRRAISEKTPIHIIGDYDADGVTASAILHLTLEHLGCTPNVRLPKRFSEGYGLSMAAVSEINDGIVITIDNGITAIAEIDDLQCKGFTVVVIDHHLPGDRLPEADVIVDPHLNPEYADEHSFRYYCGAGLALKLAEMLIKDKFVLEKLTLLAAIGTIADVVPLVGDNRRIVKRGLHLINKPGLVAGIDALLTEAVVSSPNEHDVAFKLGPMLNAPGRLYDDGAQKSFRLLIEPDKISAALMAKELVAINEERKAIVREGYERAVKIISDECLYGSSPLCIYDPETPEGVAGILASRVAEEMKTPTIVFANSVSDPELLKGSGRTFGGVNLREAIEPLGEHFESFGGHAGAVGLSIKKDNYNDIVSDLSHAIPEYEPCDENEKEYDLEILGSVILKVEKELRKYAPFGEGNPMPVFLVNGIVLSPRYGKHFKVMGADMSTLKMHGDQFDILAFRRADEYLEMGQPRKVDVIGSISENAFRYSTSIQIQADDFRASTEPRPAMSSLAAALASGSRDLE
jgi:single-stranded-DNA-specific exonuclease